MLVQLVGVQTMCRVAKANTLRCVVQLQDYPKTLRCVRTCDEPTRCVIQLQGSSEDFALRCTCDGSMSATLYSYKVIRGRGAALCI